MEEEETFVRKEMSDSSSSPSTGNSPSPPSLSSNSSPPTNESKDSPSSNSSLPSDSSPPSDNSKGSSSLDSSPPSPTSESPPPEDDSQDSPPSPPSSSSSTPPSSKASPPPPISSPPPPDKDNSPSTPPPPKKDDSPSTPPSPTNENNSPPPPKKDDSPSTPPPPTNTNNSSPPPPPPPTTNTSNSSPPPPTNTNNSPPALVPPPPPPSSKSNSPPPPPPPPTTNGSQPSASPSNPPPPNLELLPPSNSFQSSNAPPPPPPPPNVVVVSPPPSHAISPPLSDTKIPPSHNSSTSSSLEPTKHSPPLDSPSSSSTQESTKDSPGPSRSGGNGTLIGVVVAVVVLMLVAVFLTRKRKRRRLDALEHRPPLALSIRSDGSYYRQTNLMGGSIRSESYQASQQYSGGASGVMVGSNKYGYPSGPLSPNGPTGLKSWFTYEELMDVTNGFSKENMIGEGGFGCVYKGVLSDGRRVAVKQLKAGSGQGEREFRAEVEIISRVHHRHLVSLVGYCIAEYHRLLVYEFLPNNTLEHHLHEKGLPVMDWPKRMRIAIGSAKGLAYLHEDCHPRIIHRDIKSANILLEDSFEPQVADFGLAKLSNETHTHVSTRVMGTFGYMAPEYASSGKLTDRSDVFSFGVVLLEIITGRKPVDTTQPLGDESLVEWARPLLVRALETGNCDELVDQRLENNYNKAEMFIMIEAAAACVRHSAPKRPRMVQVVRALDNLDEKQDLSNGVKFGESQAFNSNQYSADIQNFRRMAFDTHSFGYESGEYDRRSSAYSSEFRSQEQRAPNSYASDARPMFRSERSNGRGFG